MTPTDYRANGYRVSMQTEQTIIDRHERNAMDAYVLPILPNATLTPPEGETIDPDVKNAVMAIAHILMMYDNVAVTRAGAKTKNTPVNSNDAPSETIATEYITECDMLIKKLRSKEGAVAGAKVDDIAKLYFVTNFFHS